MCLSPACAALLPATGINTIVHIYCFRKNISRTSAVSWTNFRSILIFASCVVGTCNILRTKLDARVPGASLTAGASRFSYQHTRGASAISGVSGQPSAPPATTCSRAAMALTLPISYSLPHPPPSTHAYVILKSFPLSAAALLPLCCCWFVSAAAAALLLLLLICFYC